MILGNFVQESADLDPCLSHGYNDILSTVVFWHNAINICSIETGHYEGHYMILEGGAFSLIGQTFNILFYLYVLAFCL